jgi:hypothetical protein
MRDGYPEFRDWSIAAVRLLQGVVEQEDGRPWDDVLIKQDRSSTTYDERRVPVGTRPYSHIAEPGIADDSFDGNVV